jgi:hypothetical protein
MARTLLCDMAEFFEDSFAFHSCRAKPCGWLRWNERVQRSKGQAHLNAEVIIAKGNSLISLIYCLSGQLHHVLVPKYLRSMLIIAQN